jgi:hypothetical protein
MLILRVRQILFRRAGWDRSVYPHGSRWQQSGRYAYLCMYCFVTWWVSKLFDDVREQKSLKDFNVNVWHSMNVCKHSSGIRGDGPANILPVWSSAGKSITHREKEPKKSGTWQDVCCWDDINIWRTSLMRWSRACRCITIKTNQMFYCWHMLVLVAGLCCVCAVFVRVCVCAAFVSGYISKRTRAYMLTKPICF